MLGAVKRTTDWNLNCIGSDLMEKFLAAEPGALSVLPKDRARAWSRWLPIPVEHRIGNCATMHYGALMQLIGQEVPMLPVITVGDVCIDDKPRYQVTRNSLRRLLNKGRSRSVMPAHVWLTWPDMTVMDLTILAALAVDRDEPLTTDREDALVVFGYDDQEQLGLRYTPWLVGEMFLHRIGALMPGAIELLDEGLRHWCAGGAAWTTM